MTKAFLVAALVAGVVVTASSQQGSFDAQVANSTLLTVPAVQQELGISPQQSKAIAKANASQASAMAKARQDTRAMAAIRAQTRQTALAQLSPAQMARLREITLQQIGAQALIQPIVAARVGLREDQRKGVATTFSTMLRQAMDALRTATLEYAKGPNGRPDPDKMQEAAALAQQTVDFDQVKQLASERSLALLSDEQRATWKKLLGKPFKSPIAPVFRDGGGAQP